MGKSPTTMVVKTGAATSKKRKAGAEADREDALAEFDEKSMEIVDTKRLSAALSSNGSNTKMTVVNIIVLDPSCKVILVATGSEVELACQVRDDLEARGIGADVVSMPCMELYEAQEEAYKHEILPNDPSILKVSIEAGENVTPAQAKAAAAREVESKDVGAAAEEAGGNPAEDADADGASGGAGESGSSGSAGASGGADMDGASGPAPCPTAASGPGGAAAEAAQAAGGGGLLAHPLPAPYNPNTPCAAAARANAKAVSQGTAADADAAAAAPAGASGAAAAPAAPVANFFFLETQDGALAHARSRLRGRSQARAAARAAQAMSTSMVMSMGHRLGGRASVQAHMHAAMWAWQLSAMQQQQQQQMLSKGPNDDIKAVKRGLLKIKAEIRCKDMGEATAVATRLNDANSEPMRFQLMLKTLGLNVRRFRMPRIARIEDAAPPPYLTRAQMQAKIISDRRTFTDKLLEAQNKLSTAANADTVDDYKGAVSALTEDIDLLQHGLDMKTKMQHNQAIMNHLENLADETMKKEIANRERTANRKQAVTDAMLTCVKAAHTEYEQRASQLLEARAKLNVLMGETKTATAAAKAAQARLFTDAFVTTRMDVSLRLRREIKKGVGGCGGGMQEEEQRSSLWLCVCVCFRLVSVLTPALCPLVSLSLPFCPPPPPPPQLMTRFATAAALYRRFVDLAGNRLEHLKRKVDAMDEAVGKVPTMMPNCGLDKRSFNDSVGLGDAKLVKAEDEAASKATSAFELKKHLPCIAKKLGVHEDPAEIPDLYPTYCTLVPGEGDPKKAAEKEDKEFASLKTPGGGKALSAAPSSPEGGQGEGASGDSGASGGASGGAVGADDAMGSSGGGSSGGSGASGAGGASSESVEDQAAKEAAQLAGGDDVTGQDMGE